MRVREVPLTRQRRNLKIAEGEALGTSPHNATRAEGAFQSHPVRVIETRLQRVLSLMRIPRALP